ncbi:hypothetical protein ACWD4F_07415 [Streptomyces aureus]|uniref:hypothetical protein n=1 Tax=Streptomyces aureus TaxID=193461 RepID=UPI00055EA766|nr:hypothetical protein [Streptomyces aureus]
MNSRHGERVTQWWEALDPSVRKALLDLRLVEGDRLPEEYVRGLKEHGIHPVQWEEPEAGHLVPGELVEFLDGKRATGT